MKKKWKAGKIAAIIFLVVIAIMAITMFSTAKKDMDALSYYRVDAGQVKDGTYNGIAETTLVKAEVEVEVKNHKITEIRLTRHDNGLGAKAESILKDMVDENTYEVDGVSGATLSSEVIKSAVSDALQKGKE